MTARPAPSLALVGATWLTASAYAAFLLNFAGNLILVRLLMPRDFGTFALVGSTVELLSLFSGFAFSQGIIQMAGEPDVEDTAYYLTSRLCAALLVLGVIAGVLIGARYNAAVGALFFLLFGARLLSVLSYVHSSQLERDFRYRGMSILRLVAAMAGLTVAIVLAWAGAGVWSLLAREGVVIIITFASLVAVTGWRYAGHYNPETARKLVAFGARLFGTRLLEVVQYRADIIALGVLLGTATVGFYDRARYLAELGHYAVSFGAVQVAFPMYARLQGDMERLGSTYRIIHYFLIRMMLPVAVVMAVAPVELVAVLYGAGWQVAASALQALTLYAFFLPILDNVKVLLTAVGRLKEAFQIRLLQVATVVPALLIAIPLWGERGAAAALSLASLVGIVTAYRLLSRHVPTLILEMYTSPVLAAAAGGGTALLLRHLFPPADDSKVAAVLYLGAATIVYVASLSVLERHELGGNVRFLWGALGRGRQAEV